MKLYRFFIIWSMLFTFVAYATESNVYVVKTGDSLSTIAQRQIGPPVYSKRHGSLYKLISMNPSMSISSVIYPGQSLIIGQNSTELSQTGEARSQDSAASTRTLASAAEPKVEEVQQLQQLKPQSPVVAVPYGQEEKLTEVSNTSSSREAPEIPHKFILSTAYGMTTLSAADPNSTTTADLFTSHDAELTVGWKQEWSTKFSTMIFGLLRDVDFQASTNSTKTLASPRKTMTGLGIKAVQQGSDRLQIEYGLGYRSDLFVHGLSTSTVVVDSLPIPEAVIGISYKALEMGKTSLGFETEGTYLMSASTDGYTVNAGYRYSVGGYIKRRYGVDSSVKLGLSYQDRAQNTSILNFHERSVSGTLTFELPLFESGETK